MSKRSDFDKQTNACYEIYVKNIPELSDGKDYDKNDDLNEQKYEEMNNALLELFKEYDEDVDYDGPGVDSYNSSIFMYNNPETILKVYTDLNGQLFLNTFKPFKLQLFIEANIFSSKYNDTDTEKPEELDDSEEEEEE